MKTILADVKIRVRQNAIVNLDSNPILGTVSEQSPGFGGTPATPEIRRPGSEPLTKH